MSYSERFYYREFDNRSRFKRGRGPVLAGLANGQAEATLSHQ